MVYVIVLLRLSIVCASAIDLEGLLTEYEAKGVYFSDYPGLLHEIQPFLDTCTYSQMPLYRIIAVYLQAAETGSLSLCCKFYLYLHLKTSSELPLSSIRAMEHPASSTIGRSWSIDPVLWHLQPPSRRNSCPFRSDYYYFDKGTSTHPRNLLRA